MTNQDLITAAFAEDLPNGDLTTDNLKEKEVIGYAFLVAKADIVISGMDLFEQSIRHIAPETKLNWFFKDGDPILKGQKVCSLEGNLIPILKAERIALNFLGYLSGIATTTHVFVKACGNAPLRVLDTRKTLPAYRHLAKQAVLHGGGKNHRMSLSDAVLIKENHVRIAGGVQQALEQVRQTHKGPIEIETTTLEEVQQAVDLKAERILLDNMDNETLVKALELIPDGIESEASGNMSVERVKQLSEIQGLNYVSVGALTHSAPCADYSLLFEWPDFHSVV